MFIEMTGKTLIHMMHEGEMGERNPADVGIQEESIVRVNRQGDIEVRRPHGWDFVGGLIGEYEARVKHATGLDWADPLGSA